MVEPDKRMSLSEGGSGNAIFHKECNNTSERAKQYRVYSLPFKPYLITNARLKDTGEGFILYSMTIQSRYSSVNINKALVPIIACILTCFLESINNNFYSNVSEYIKQSSEMDTRKKSPTKICLFFSASLQTFKKIPWHPVVEICYCYRTICDWCCVALTGSWYYSSSEETFSRWPWSLLSMIPGNRDMSRAEKSKFSAAAKSGNSSRIAIKIASNLFTILAQKSMNCLSWFQALSVFKKFWLMIRRLLSTLVVGNFEYYLSFVCNSTVENTFI